jgi:hypothetical protein
MGKLEALANSIDVGYQLMNTLPLPLQRIWGALGITHIHALIFLPNPCLFYSNLPPFGFDQAPFKPNSEALFWHSQQFLGPYGGESS